MGANVTHRVEVIVPLPEEIEVSAVTEWEAIEIALSYKGVISARIIDEFDNEEKF